MSVRGSVVAQNDILAATNISLNLLNGNPTRDRRIAIEIALSIAQIKNLVKVPLRAPRLGGVLCLGLC